MDSLNHRLDTLGHLPEGWVDGTGHRPTAAALGLAALLAEPLAATATAGMGAFPTEDGGIELEWRQDQLTHSARIGPHGELHLLTLDPADPEERAPQNGHQDAAAALRAEATAMDRLTEQVAWPVLPTPEPQIDSATLRAVAALLDTLEAE